MSDERTELVGALDVGVLGRHVLMVPERAPLSARRMQQDSLNCDVKAHLEPSVDHTRQTQTQVKPMHCKNTQSFQSWEHESRRVNKMSNEVKSTSF